MTCGWRMRFQVLVTLMVRVAPLAVALPARSVEAQSGETQAPAEATAAAVNPLLLQPPKNREEIESRIQLAKERIEALKPQAEAAVEGADEAAVMRKEAVAALLKEWQEYLALLERAISIHETIKSLSSEQRTQELSQEIEDLKGRTAELRRLPRPISATEEQVADISTLHQEMDSRLTALSELQTRRAAQFATGFKQQRETLEKELNELRQKRQQGRSPAEDTAPAPADAELKELERRRLEVQIARTELALHVPRLETEKTELAGRQDAQYLEVLRDYVVALRQRMAALTEARGRSTIEIIELRRQAAADPAQIAMLDLQHFRESVLLRYFKNRKLLNTLKDRFPASELDRLRNRIALRSGMWGERLESLEQRTGQEAMAVRSELRSERHAFERERESLRARLGETLAELRELQSIRDRATQRFRELSRQVSTVSEKLEPVERTRMGNEAASLRAGMQEEMKQAITEAQEVVARIKEAMALVGEYTSNLQRMETDVYWTALKRRESGLAGLDWRAVPNELRALAGGATRLQPGDAASAPPAGLFPEKADIRDELAVKLAAIGRSFGSIPRTTWLWWLGSTAAGVGVSVWVRRWSARRALGLRRRLSGSVDREGSWVSEAIHVSEQIDLLGLRLLGTALIPFVVGASVMLLAWSVDVDSLSRSVAYALVGLPLGGYVAIAAARAVFAKGDARHRVIPCNDAVARHYRRWLNAIAILSVILLLPVTLLHVMGLAPALRSLFWEAFKTGLSVLIVGFLARRRLVLWLGRSEERHWGWPVAAAVYPLVLLSAVGLLILEVVGYGVLVEFIGAGVLASVALALGVIVAIEYVCDLLDRYPGVMRPPAPPPAAEGVEVDAGLPSEEEPAALSDAGHVATFIRLFKALLRLGAVALVVLLVMRVWGLTAYQEGLNWNLVGLGALVVVIAVIVDRLVFTALHTLYASKRIPASTAKIVRRWVRGLLSVVVVLCFVAMAGYQIDNIWTLLTTLLAMIAIGFVAVWSVLSNIMSTLIILIWRPFNVGEEIDIQPEGIKGEVVDINFMYTLLKCEDGMKTTVPNSLFMQKFIRRKPLRRRQKRTLAEQLVAAEPLHE